jgi:hypothetical protein
VALLELDEAELEPLPLDGMDVPRIRVGGPPPYSAVRLGGQQYLYERSFPVKGHGASLPNFLREHMAAGKKPLLVERIDRFYVYLA